MIDYGFSKRLEETLEKWGRENVLRDVVRDHPDRSSVRADRALPGQRARRPRQPRGGRAHHAGGVPRRRRSVACFPSRSATACAPWQPLKLYMGGVREDEDWTLRVDTGEYSPWLGESYQTFARLGLGVSAIAERRPRERAGRAVGRVLQAARRRSSTRRRRRRSFFDGIDTSIPGLFSAIRRPAPAGAPALLSAIDVEVRAAIAAFSMQNPSASVPALARGLAATRAAIDALRRRAGRRVHPAASKSSSSWTRSTRRSAIDVRRRSPPCPARSCPGQRARRSRRR